MQHVDSEQLELLSLLMRKSIAGSNGAGRRVVDVGPFTAAIHETDPLVWLSYALPWPSATPEQFSRQHIIDLRRVFREAGRTLRLEFFEPLHPWLGAFLSQNDLLLQAAQPLMICSPSDLRPAGGEEVVVHNLMASDSDETISQFLIVAKLCFNEPPSISPRDIDTKRQQLRAGVYRSAYATVRDVMAGVGSISPANDELVGVGTLAPFRRQGVASGISSHLVMSHFHGGAPLAWLSAGDEAAKAAYQNIGFQVVGLQLNYIDGMTSDENRVTNE